ncbi:MAG: HsdM family class I SAM-dependent methyltransferase [Acidimicrobiales bacterium]
MPRAEAERRAWLREVGGIAEAGAAPADVVSAVAVELDRAFPERGLRLRRTDRVAVPPAPAGSGPELLGLAYESCLDRGHRRRAGAHFTPPALARRLSEIALDGMIDGSPTVCDPACGGGVFLLAAGRVLAEEGGSRRAIVESRLFGVDLDPLAVAVTEAALYLWSGTTPAGHLVVGDALADPWPVAGVSVVVGNPPFQNQLGRSTTRPPADVHRLRLRFGEAVGQYTDTAWLFLAAAVESVRPGGRVVLVQPQSLLAARDASVVRRRSTLEGLWLTDRPVFDAAVRVCAPVIRVADDPPHRTVRRWRGNEVEELAPVDHPADGDRWAPLAAGILGVPPVDLGEGPRLGDVVTATAGFRDQFYGLADFVIDGDGDDRDDDAARPRLVTSGIIEPGRVAWGERPVRFAGRRWRAPRVDLRALRAGGDPAVARWVDERLVPKVVVATQSRVVEAAVDRDGIWVPSTPVISVVGPADRLDHVAAVLLAPPVTAWAMRRFAGAALAADAVKLAARQVLEVPLPADGPDWDAAARLVAELPAAVEPASRRALLLEAGERMCAAFRLGPAGADVVDWWAARLPA